MRHRDESFWDDLLEYVEDRRVIPIVGPELLRLEGEGSPSVYGYLAGRLAQRLSIEAGPLPAEGALHHVISQYLQTGGRREEIYPRLRSIMKEATFPVPRPLMQLAGIAEFTLFVTTTFDSLLERAINEQRPQQRTETIIYSPNSKQDLPADVRKLSCPTVFHLLGKLSATPDYVITEEDTLEFLCEMQAERPQRLFDALKNNHLLILGCAFPDWLARFFVRLAKGGRLSVQRDWREIIADQTARQDANLALFLQNFSYHTQIFTQGNAVDFVDELWRRYAQRHPPKVDPGRPITPSSSPPPPEAEMAAGSVFLSYASEDLAAVQRVADALSAAGVQVWFDKRHLEAGDLYDAKIMRNIKGCSLFLPAVSASTERRLEGYFRREWRMAAERAMDIADSVPFILPLALDNTDPQAALVPPAFHQAQWSHASGGQIDPAFAKRVIALVRAYHLRNRGATGGAA